MEIRKETFGNYVVFETPADEIDVATEPTFSVNVMAKRNPKLLEMEGKG